MSVLHLCREVTISGPNIFGMPSRTTFLPSASAEWKYSILGCAPIPLRPNLVRVRKRRCVISAFGRNLNIAEHILAARFGGKNGILGVEVHSNPWPAYHGRALEIVQVLEQNSIIAHEQIAPRYSVAKTVWFDYDNLRGGQRGFTSIEPASEDALILKITCAYKGLGMWDRTYILPDPTVFKKIVSAHTPGRPPILYHLSRFGWKHHDKITWQQEHSLEETRELFALHRAQDVLGALALLCRDGLFVGRVISHCSGHLGDCMAVKKADEVLIPLKTPVRTHAHK